MTAMSLESMIAARHRVSETMMPRAVHAETVEAEAEKRLQQRIRSSDADHRFLQEKCDRLEKQIREFEEASGLHLGGWQGGRELGEAIKRYRAGSRVDARRRLEQARDHLANLVEYLEADIAALPPAPPEAT